MIRVLHIITATSIGGAEMMLYKLAANMKSEQFYSVVLSIKTKGNMAPLFASQDIPVISLGLDRVASLPVALLKLKQIIDTTKPDLIQGWMYHGNLIALMARYLQRKRIPIAWNIRHSIYDIRFEKKTTQHVISLGRKLSSHINAIIYNATISANQHESAGFTSNNSMIIPNGFDTDMFCPNKNARSILRNDLKVPIDTPLIGMIARYHHMKDHINFLDSAKRIHILKPDVRFLLVGAGLNKINTELRRLIEIRGLDSAIFLMGERNDIPTITAALDVACLSSFSEGFPNTIGEAMACGIPCVATDVGDTTALIGSAGRTVPARDPRAFAGAVMELLNMTVTQRRRLGVNARNQIMQYYSINNIVRKYENLYLQLTGLGNKI